MAKEFVLYVGDDVEAIGTLRDIAKTLKIRPESVRYYGTETYRKRCITRKTPYEKVRFLLELGEVDLDDGS